MQHIIKIRGNDKPITATGDVKTIISRWNEYINTKKDSIFQMNGNTYRVSAIQSIEKDTQSNAIEKRIDNSKKEITEYINSRRSFLQLSPEEKSKKIGFAGLIYWGFTGNKLSDNIEDKNKVIDIQKKFFEKNPNRMFINPTELKQMFKDRQLNSLVYDIVKNQLASDF